MGFARCRAWNGMKMRAVLGGGTEKRSSASASAATGGIPDDVVPTTISNSGEIAEVADDPAGLVGTVLEGKYRLDARVAEGSFGVVYASQHMGLARPLAIKVLKRQPRVGTEEWAERVADFLEEARLLARLRHPAVVAVIDAGVTSSERYPFGLPWMVMEWIDGETLAYDLARRSARGDGGRTPPETFALLRPVVEAVADAHDLGIVHRDLNPNNLMLAMGTRATSMRILDFGIAKVMDDNGSPSRSRTTDTTVRAFSPAYAAPEQLSGVRSGPWTDVYALGLLFTEVLCGRSVLPDNGADAHYRAAFHPARRTPALFGVDVGEWEPVLSRALALHLHERYASARELLAALDRAPPVASAVSTHRERGAASDAFDVREEASRARAHTRLTSAVPSSRRVARACGRAPCRALVRTRRRRPGHVLARSSR